MSNSNALCKHARNTNTNFMDFLESKDFDPNKVMECSFTDQLVFFDDPRERTRTQTLRVVYKTEQSSMILVAKTSKYTSTV